MKPRSAGLFWHRLRGGHACQPIARLCNAQLFLRGQMTWPFATISRRHAVAHTIKPLTPAAGSCSIVGRPRISPMKPPPLHHRGHFFAPSGRSRPAQSERPITKPLANSLPTRFPLSRNTYFHAMAKVASPRRRYVTRGPDCDRSTSPRHACVELFSARNGGGSYFCCSWQQARCSTAAPRHEPTPSSAIFPTCVPPPARG